MSPLKYLLNLFVFFVSAIQVSTAIFEKFLLSNDITKLENVSGEYICELHGLFKRG